MKLLHANLHIYLLLWKKTFEKKPIEPHIRKFKVK
jgi:hypothetical protein